MGGDMHCAVRRFSMANPETAIPPVARAERSINDNLSTTSPSPKSTFIGIICVVGAVILLVVYYKTIGF
jgi:hypothetical protein